MRQFKALHIFFFIISLAITALNIGPLVHASSGVVTSLYGGGAGQIPYQSAANATAFLAAGSAGQVFTSGGAGAPTWTTVSGSDLGSILAVGNTLGTANVPAGSTYYLTFAYTGGVGVNTGPITSSAESGRLIILPVDCTLQNFYFKTLTAQPANGSLVVTVRKNGVDSGVTVTVAGGSAAGLFSDITHTLAVTAGDLISIGLTNNSPDTVSAGLQQWAILAK